MHEVKNLFKRHFSCTPTHVVKAPGCLELLGNHTDYNDGLAMSVVVDKYSFMASAPRSDGRIELVSSAFPGRETFWLTELKKNSTVSWTDYVKGVLDQLRKHGVNFNGFNAAIHGTISMGAGMDSSAALEVATALTVRKLYPYCFTETGATLPPKRNKQGELPPLTKTEKIYCAKICQAADNQFIDVQSGLLDPISSLFGKAWNAMGIDFRFLTVEHAPMIGNAIVVCDSGAKHELVGGDYNEIRKNCESATKKLGAKSLRSVEISRLKANKSKLTQREFECAWHVVSEIQRVVFAERALGDEDYRQFGQYMFQSHESSRDFLKNSTTKLDTLVEFARKHPGCLGARLTGGGFGGATINLVAYHQVENFIETIVRQYEERTGHKIKPVVCQIVDGAS